MGYIILKKRLSDDSDLTLEKYFLNDSEANQLNRPIGSPEIVIRIMEQSGGGNTPPSASWYLSEEDFQKIYDAISNLEDFKKARYFLESVESEKDASRLEEFLKGFRH